MNGIIRVLTVSDHAMVRAAICRLLDAERDVQVVGRTATGKSAIELAASLAADVVVVDMSLSDLSVLEITRAILRQRPGARIVVLGFHAHHEYLTRLVRAGATGFVTKTAAPALLIEAVRKTARNEFYVEPAMMEQVIAASAWGANAPERTLSDRELQVLARLARGQETREVAGALQLSKSTIETHRGRILKKLGLRNNSDITRFAIRRGLIRAE